VSPTGNKYRYSESERVLLLWTLGKLPARFKRFGILPTYRVCPDHAIQRASPPLFNYLFNNPSFLFQRETQSSVKAGWHMRCP
jgi:hypothetical protein